MPFSVGDPVLVLTLKRRGAVVDARGQRYRVLVGGVTVTCREDDLRLDSPAGVRAGTGAARRPASVASPEAVSGLGGHDDEPRSSIDLHGFTTLEAREALLRHVDAALREGHAVVEVVHGIGTGKVRAAVLAVVRDMPSVRAVRPHPANKGVTLLYL